MWTHDRSAEMNANAIGVKTFEISFDDINNNIMGTSFLKKPRRIYGYKAIITSHTTAPQFREADKKCAAAAGAAAATGAAARYICTFTVPWAFGMACLRSYSILSTIHKMENILRANSDKKLSFIFIFSFFATQGQ